MTSITLEAENGRRLTLHVIDVPDREAYWRYQATLEIPEGSATTIVEDHGTSLAMFFRGLAIAWQGFDGVRSFRSLEGQLTIDARHDQLGTVSCTVTLGQAWPPEWSFVGVLDFGAGARLEGVADEVEQLLS